MDGLLLPRLLRIHEHADAARGGPLHQAVQSAALHLRLLIQTQILSGWARHSQLAYHLVLGLVPVHIPGAHLCVPHCLLHLPFSHRRGVFPPRHQLIQEVLDLFPRAPSFSKQRAHVLYRHHPRGIAASELTVELILLSRLLRQLAEQ